MKKRKILKIVAIVLTITAVVIAGFLIFFLFSRKCPDKACFDSALERCFRVSFLNDAQDAAWQYKINPDILCFVGKCKECRVDVTLLSIKQGTSDIGGLQGLGMSCNLPFSVVFVPQDDLSKCHGALKEELQYQLIKKMHSYIVSNIGQISPELNKILT